MVSHQDSEIPPSSKEAEQIVLGSILREGLLMDEALSVLRTPTCFYYPEHGIIFRAMVNIHTRRQPIDTLTVRTELTRLDKLKEIGSSVELVKMVELTHDLLTGVASTAHFSSHAQIVWDKYRLRQLIALSNQTACSCYTESNDAETILNNCQSELLRLLMGDNSSGVSPIYDGLAEVYESLEARKGGALPPGSVQTSFPEVDKVLDPMEKGTLNVIGGQSSTGKTQFVCQIAADVAIRQCRPVLMVSWEMTRRLLIRRIACDVAKVDKTKAKHGELTEQEWNSLTQAQETIHGAPLFLPTKTNMDLFRVRAEAIRLKGTSGLDLLIVDYLQLIPVPGKFSSTNDKYEYLTRSLKLLAMELDIPIILLSQVNRAFKERKGLAPQLSDLRGSGMIEADADTVLFTWHDDTNSYIEIRKQREGDRERVELRFERGRWYSQARDFDIPY